jgi:hypothetical protein
MRILSDAIDRRNFGGLLLCPKNGTTQGVLFG